MLPELKHALWVLYQYLRIPAIICGVWLLFIGCCLLYTSRVLRPYTVTSAGAGSVGAKIRRLENRIDLPTPVIDIEYRCDIRPSAIGPSRHDYLVAVKVAPADVPVWLNTYGTGTVLPARAADVAPMTALRLPAARWRHGPTGTMYAQGTERTIVYPAEGILFFQWSN